MLEDVMGSHTGKDGLSRSNSLPKFDSEGAGVSWSRLEGDSKAGVKTETL